MGDGKGQLSVKVKVLRSLFRVRVLVQSSGGGSEIDENADAGDTFRGKKKVCSSKRVLKFNKRQKETSRFLSFSDARSSSRLSRKNKYKPVKGLIKRSYAAVKGGLTLYLGSDFPTTGWERRSLAGAR